ncbi:hypothetical protein F4777DRAFT_575556 [Nemania sp. FL0916]|nr:hypothetical protein F4777DRAFT_575556 [Nemania sp. FL0916]
MEVETLIPQLQDTLSEIKIAVSQLSAKAQYNELDQLEQKRERLLADLQASFEKEGHELEAKRRKEREDIKKKRKQEDEERVARRQREDDEIKKAISNEDKQRQHKRDSKADSIEDETGQKMDEIEELARKMVREGKQKLKTLEEKRKELNHRIDEQLKQPLPASPARRRDKSKKDESSSPKDKTDGNPTSKDLRSDESSPKGNPKLDAAPKSQPAPPTDSPPKSPEKKKDGELPFQDGSSGIAQTAKEYSNLPRSFAEVLKSNVSNGSKGKLNLEKGSSGEALQGTSAHSEHGNEKVILGKSERVLERTNGIPINDQSKIEQDHDATQPNETRHFTRATSVIENTAAPPEKEPEPQTSEDPDHNSPRHKTLPDIQPVQSDGNVVSNPRQRSDGSTRVPESASRKTTNGAESEVHTVDSEPSLQPPGLSSTFEERRRGQNNEAYNKMGLGEPTIPDLFFQGYSGDCRGGLQAVKQSLSPAEQSSEASVNPLLVMSPSLVQEITALDEEPVHLPLDLGPSSLPEYARNADAEYPPPGEPREVHRSSSPLPVETETVRGQDRLLDDHKSVSDHFETHTQDEEIESLPHTPIDGEELLVVLTPNAEHRMGGQGLRTLIDELGSWAILTDQIGKDDHSYHLSPNRPHSPAVDNQEKSALKGKTETCGSPDIANDTSRLEAEIGQQPTHQHSRCPTPAGSPANIASHETHDSYSYQDHSFHDTDPADSQEPSYQQWTPAKRLIDQEHPDSAGPGPDERTSLACDPGPPDATSPIAKRRHSSFSGPHIHLKHRGRQRQKSFESPERALNPREQMFQGRDDDSIDIRSAWFKRSKRGSS